MVPEPDQLPANWPNGPALEADPWVARLCALPSPPQKTKSSSPKRPHETSRSQGSNARTSSKFSGHLGILSTDNTVAMHWFPQRNSQSTVVVVIVTIELWIGLGRL